MPRRVEMEPRAGLRGFIEDDGRQVDGIYTMFVDIYAPDERPTTSVQTLASLKAKETWDPSRTALSWRLGIGTFTLGPEVLRGLPDSTLIRVRVQHRSLPEQGP
jgi:hypothetical protein